MKKELLHRKDLLKRNKEGYILILYNDEINTFDHVIKTLVEVCGHDVYQAEQCTLLAHYKGSCEIKRGSKGMLQSMCRSIKARGLKSKVESL